LEQHVVVIDGDRESRDGLVGILSSEFGYTCLEAQSAEEGLRLLRRPAPLLAFIGDALPDRDGMQFLEQVLEQHPLVSTIYVSEDGSGSTILRAFRLGVLDLLSKPLDRGEVTAAVGRMRSSEVPNNRLADLTRDLRAANEELRLRLQELNTVYAIGRAVTSLLDLSQVLNRVVEGVTYTLRAEEGMLMLLDPTSDELYLRAAKDMRDKTARNLRLAVDDSAAGRALRWNRPVNLSGDEVKLTTGYLVKSLLYVPVRAAERGVIGVLGVANRSRSQRFTRRDIAIASALADYAGIAIENARLYREAETERAKLHAILGQAEEAILVVDEENRLLLCNAAAREALHLTSADMDGAQGPPPVEAVVQASAILELFADEQEGGGAVHSEVSLDSGRIYNAHLTPVGGVGRVLMLQDVTHLKELSRLKSEFVAAVSHDMRTPLTSVQGYIDLLAKVGPVNEKQERFLARMETSLRSITDLIDDLLDIRRIEAELDLEMGMCDLRGVIDGVVQRMRPYAEDEGQDLVWQAPPSALQVRCNPRRMAQAVENLVSNAIKYSNAGGQVAVTASEDEGHVFVSVSDEGIGISREVQPRVFDRFYRGKSEDVAGIRGTGLGLSIVKAVIDKHGGRVWVESQPGVGSTFSFILPAPDAQT